MRRNFIASKNLNSTSSFISSSLIYFFGKGLTTRILIEDD